MNMKAFHFSSAALVAVISSLAAFQWADIVDAKTASEIVMGIGTIKALIALFVPGTDAPATGTAL